MIVMNLVKQSHVILHGGGPFENAYRMAIQALEKQIPKKPIYIANLGCAALWLCPVCERRIVRSDLKYCHQCGQKLDWSDEDERS